MKTSTSWLLYCSSCQPVNRFAALATPIWSRHCHCRFREDALFFVRKLRMTKVFLSICIVTLIKLVLSSRSMIISRTILRSNRHRIFRLPELQCAKISIDNEHERKFYKQIDFVDVDSVTRKVFYIDMGTDSVKPPLVILCGTAQTVNTFSPHFRQISKERRLIIIELRCQGMTELLSEYGTIDQHVKDFHKIIVDHLGLRHIHLAGFSFGGRVSLAIAAMHPELVGRLSVTGVPLERPALGNHLSTPFIPHFSNAIVELS